MDEDTLPVERLRAALDFEMRSCRLRIMSFEKVTAGASGATNSEGRYASFALPLRFDLKDVDR